MLPTVEKHGSNSSLLQYLDPYLPGIEWSIGTLERLPPRDWTGHMRAAWPGWSADTAMRKREPK